MLAALVVVSVAEFAYDIRPGGPLNPAPVVRLTSVGWSTGGQVLSTGPGARIAPGAATALTLVFTNGAWGTIQFTKASTNASGFSVVSSSLPTIPPGATENLTVTVSSPYAAYSGPLWIDLE